MSERMYGVVLWTDESDSKAVIWCEDHGNLAYYSAPDQSVHQGVPLDAGDLIQFDLREERQCRRARNLERVGPGYAPALPKRLTPRQEQSRMGSVVPFPAPLQAAG